MSESVSFRTGSQGSVSLVWFHGANPGAEAAMGLWRESGPGAAGGRLHCGLTTQTLPKGIARSCSS